MHHDSLQRQHSCTVDSVDAAASSAALVLQTLHDVTLTSLGCRYTDTPQDIDEMSTPVSPWAQLFRTVECDDAVQPHVPSDAHASPASKLNWATLGVDPLTPKRCTVTEI